MEIVYNKSMHTMRLYETVYWSLMAVTTTVVVTNARPDVMKRLLRMQRDRRHALLRYLRRRMLRVVSA